MRRVMAVLAVALLVSGCAPGATTEPSVPPASPTASETAPASSSAAAPTATATATPMPTPTRPQWDVTTASSLQVVVNKLRPMDPPDFAPELVAVSTGQEGGELVRPELEAALAELDAAMRAAIGEGTYVTSSYRSAALQAQYYQDAIARFGQAAADTTSARPGHSEHQTGLAIDLMSTAMQCRLDRCFGETAAGRWIAAHAWEHGFVVRYPQGSDAVTGYAWEPWHLRYVGDEVSTAMHDAGVATLEEHFGLEPAPAYADEVAP
ncbi:MAG: M15 family metallopeptidase [Actinomycetota bacterium]